MSRAVRTLLLSIVTVLVSVAVVTPAWGSRVVVIVSDDLSPYTDPVETFLEALGEPATVYNLRGRESDAMGLAKRLAKDPPEVIFALGAKAAWTARTQLPKVPLVYTSVLAPTRFGIEGTRTAGVSMVAGPELAVSEFHNYFPDYKKIGVLRGPSIPDARIEAMESAAKLLGIELEVQRVRNPRDVRQALRTLGPKVDAFWLQPDRAVIDRPTYRFVVEETRRTRRPLVVETENMVRAGGMFATVPDARGTGRQAASIVREVLDKGRYLRGEIVDPEEVDVVLSLSSLRAAGAELDPLMLDFVDVVVR
ncbi:MAG: hypothetical protein EA397_05340 [Deltaproteobacteria bacterium]|nr:MAG: hypothetical protein EA397_05340 [Deltaproteobacteria bacterium]